MRNRGPSRGNAREARAQRWRWSRLLQACPPARSSAWVVPAEPRRSTRPRPSRSMCASSSRRSSACGACCPRASRRRQRPQPSTSRPRRWNRRRGQLYLAMLQRVRRGCPGRILGPRKLDMLPIAMLVLPLKGCSVGRATWRQSSCCPAPPRTLLKMTSCAYCAAQRLAPLRQQPPWRQPRPQRRRWMWRQRRRPQRQRRRCKRRRQGRQRSRRSRLRRQGDANLYHLPRRRRACHLPPRRPLPYIPTTKRPSWLQPRRLRWRR